MAGKKSRIKKKSQKLIKGVLSKHRRNYGFVRQEEGDDIFIPSSDIGGAMDGDSVLVSLSDDRGRDDRGKIEKILTRANREIVGSLLVERNKAFVVPMTGKSSDVIQIDKRNLKGAANGDRVLASIIKWPDKKTSAQALIKEIISKKDEWAGESRALLRAFGVMDKFPDKVAKEAAAVPVSVSLEDIKDRRDLRSREIITLDGPYAKDLDDAISAEILENGNYSLGVHIADVSHYVKAGSPIDNEALKRGTSIYLSDLTVPMLPHELSSGICSLHPQVDRLTLSIFMEIDRAGNLVNYDFYESVINSKGRLVYGEEFEEKNKAFHPMLKIMVEIADLLKEKREQRGGLDFDLDESEIVIDDQGNVTDIRIKSRGQGDRMIEEFMILANEVVATRFFHMEMPAIYRVHEEPDPDKIEDYNHFYKIIGQNLPEGHRLVNNFLLRTMKKAKYSEEDLGHYGLGLDHYCHFTAPIRRYPDLFIHRIIKDNVERDLTLLAEVAQSSSAMERNAEELSRADEKLKKAKYMANHTGEQYTGTISGITSYGFFVELDNTVEGMVRVDSLADDYYIYDEENYRFIGERHKKRYALGNIVRVEVESADVYRGEVNFVLADRVQQLGSNGPDSRMKV